MSRWIPLLSLLLVGCDAGDTDSDADSDGSLACGAPYEPFNAANYENQLLRVAAYDQIVAIRKSEGFSAEDFAEIEALYVDTAELSAKVAGRTDDHADAAVVDIGAVLHADITAAIAAGKAGDNIAVQGQIIDKTLQRFFALSVYHEGRKAADTAETPEGIQEGWDEGFGYFGVSNDGTATTGVASTLAKRDAEFGLSLVDTAFNGLVAGRCAVADDDREQALAALEDVDRALLTGFAASVVHEMDEYADESEIKFHEGLLFWNAARDATNTRDPAAAATIDAEFAKGWESLTPATVRDAMSSTWGLGS